MVVVEMGANHQGEIAELSTIAQPTHGLITNIGKAHLEGFGGLAGVKKGKGELYAYLSKKKRVVFVTTRNETLMEMVSKKHSFGEIVFYCSENSPVNPTLLEDVPFVTYENQENQAITTHLPGRHNFDNICAALAIGHYFGVTSDDAHRAISEYQPDNNRSQVFLQRKQYDYAGRLQRQPQFDGSRHRSFVEERSYPQNGDSGRHARTRL